MYMPWQQRVWEMIGQPVGISLQNGQGTSGVLCNIRDDSVYIIEYLYQSQFAMKRYSFSVIQDVHGFPPCNQRPQRRLY